MKQINGTVTLSFLDEDNQQRVIFRVVPLCTREGVVFRDKETDFPDQGSLRIVPDKREQSTFKERMRAMGCLCAIHLASEGKELAKVRLNRNYDPGQGETNQFAIYSDVICEFAEDGVFEVFPEGAAYAGALSQRVLLRRGQVLYGPVERGAAENTAVLRPFGNDSYVLKAVPLPDGTEHTFYWNPELTVNWRQRRSTLRHNRTRPEDGDAAEEAEATEPAAEKPAAPKTADRAPAAPATPAVRAAEPAQQPVAEAQPPRKPERTEPQPPRDARSQPRSDRLRGPEGDAPLPIGKRLSILDESVPFDKQIERLDQPLSQDANLLGRGADMAQEGGGQSPSRVNGTPLLRTAAKTPQPIRRGEALHYVVEKQIRTAHREHADHEPDYRTVENPIENLSVALAKAWESPETRQQAILSLSGNEAFTQAFLKQLHAQGRETRAVAAAQEQLQDIEAERLSLLMQLEATKGDLKRAMETLHADLTHKKREELAQLENQLHAVREERDALLATVAALGEQAQAQSLEALGRCGLQLCAASGDALAITPMVGRRRSPAEMIEAVRVAMNRQGFACNEDDATEMLLHFALNDEFCICGDTVSEAEMCARAMLEGLGLLGVAARTYGSILLNVASLLPANGLRTPTVEVCDMNRPAVSAYGHKTVRVVERHSPLCAEPPLPVVYAPAYRPVLREARATEPVPPASLESFATLREEAAPLMEQGELWFTELDRQLGQQRSRLQGIATQQMRIFVSAASGRLRGGFLAAADAAVLGWVVPAVCRREISAEALRQSVEGLPRCLSALGFQ